MGIIRCLGCPSWQVIGNIQNQNKMKQIILIIMSLLTFSCSSKAQQRMPIRNPIRKSSWPISPVPELRRELPMPLPKQLAVSCTGLLRLRPTPRQTLIGIIRQAAVLWKWRMKPHAPRWAEKRSICKITMWYSSAIRYGGTCVRVRSIHFLRNMISPVRQSFRLPLPAAVLLQAA